VIEVCLLYVDAPQVYYGKGWTCNGGVTGSSKGNSCILIDIRMPGSTGFNLQQKLGAYDIPGYRPL